MQTLTSRNQAPESLSFTGSFLVGSNSGSVSVASSEATIELPADVQMLNNSHDDRLPAPVVTYEPHQGIPFWKGKVAHIDLSQVLQ